MPSLLTPPFLLTASQRKILWLTAALVAATRWYAMATSPWDWDEVQLMAGVRDFEVTRHQPHPAGFPVYILLANAVQLFGRSDFQSLQVVSFLAACTLFPLLFLIGRELSLDFRTAWLAAVMFAFLPNVWYFGGTVFSDITGTAINLAAILMLLRGRRGGRAFLIGCALVGCALGVRPHGGFILIVPLLIATWYQRRYLLRIVAGALIVIAIAGGAYTGAALASESVAGYIGSVRHFQKWVHDVDTFANPGRPPLAKLADEFLVRPMGAGRLSMIVTAFAVIGLVIAAFRRHAGVWIAFLTFAPYLVFAWLMHDVAGYHRYSTAYVAVYALLAAYGVGQVTMPLGHRLAPVAHVVVIAALTARYVWWTLPAIEEVRSTIAPTHAACTFVQALVAKGERVWIDDSMSPWAAYYFHDREVVKVGTPAEITGVGDEIFLTEGTMAEPGAHVFRRRRGRVAEIHPERHFEASAAPVSIIWRFGEGWGDPEGHLDLNWRWMGARSVAIIPSGPGPAELSLRLGKPVHLTPDVEVRLNGTLLERFAMPAEAITKTWRVEGLAGQASTLEISTSVVSNPRKEGIGGDPRDLGLQLFEYSWTPLPR